MNEVITMFYNLDIQLTKDPNSCVIYNEHFCQWFGLSVMSVLSLEMSVISVNFLVSRIFAFDC